MITNPHLRNHHMKVGVGCVLLGICELITNVDVLITCTGSLRLTLLLLLPIKCHPQHARGSIHTPQRPLLLRTVMEEQRMKMAVMEVGQSLHRFLWNMAEKIGMTSRGDVVTDMKQFVTLGIKNPKAYCFILEHCVDKFRNYDERGRTMSQAYQAECIEANNGRSAPRLLSKNGVELTVAQVHQHEEKLWRRKIRRTQVRDKDSPTVILKSYNHMYRVWFNMDSMPSSSYALVDKEARDNSGLNEAGDLWHGHKLVRSM